MKFCNPFAGVCFATIAGLTWLNLSIAVLAKPNQPSISVKPTGIGSPGGRVPGSPSRDGCLGQRSITPLAPETRAGLTVAQYPTFFFYIPADLKPTEAEFELRDQNRKRIYKTQLNMNGKAGIASLTLPTQAFSGLEVNQNYRWFVSLRCKNAPDRGGDLSVQGTIKRVETSPALASQLERGTLRDRIALYQNAGLWYDVIATLAQLRRSSPNDATLKATWSNLLTSVGLNAIANAPLI